MDISKFGKKKTGRLVRISEPEEDWAFVPDPLPPTWEFPSDLWPLLAEARESLARLDGIGRTLPNPELLLKPLQGREALRSSSLEGTYATPEELLLFEVRPRSPRSPRDPANDWMEVHNYSRALRQGMKLMEELPFSLRLIREMHNTLLSGVRGRDKSPGEFRQYQVHVGSERRYIPPPPELLKECLDSFERSMNEAETPFGPLVWSFLLHYQFEAIHPFRDGNGRLGRALLSLVVFSWCKLSLPWLYLSAYFEEQKDEYIRHLFRISTDGAWDEWVAFCLRGTIVQAKDSIKRCDALRQLKESFHERVEGASARTHPIIEELFSFPMQRISDLARKFAVSYPTAKVDVDRLVRAGILQELEGFNPKTFFSREILKIAYGSDS